MWLTTGVWLGIVEHMREFSHFNSVRNLTITATLYQYQLQTEREREEA